MVPTDRPSNPIDMLLSPLSTERSTRITFLMASVLLILHTIVPLLHVLLCSRRKQYTSETPGAVDIGEDVANDEKTSNGEGEGIPSLRREKRCNAARDANREEGNKIEPDRVTVGTPRQFRARRKSNRKKRTRRSLRFSPSSSVDDSKGCDSQIALQQQSLVKRHVLKGREMPKEATSKQVRGSSMSGYLWKRARRKRSKPLRRLSAALMSMSPRERKKTPQQRDMEKEESMWQRRFFELPPGKFLLYYRTYSRARRARRKQSDAKPDGVIDLSRVVALGSTKDVKKFKRNFVCVIKLTFQGDDKKTTVYSLGVDEEHEHEEDHWYELLRERIRTYRPKNKSLSSEDDSVLDTTWKEDMHMDVRRNGSDDGTNDRDELSSNVSTFSCRQSLSSFESSDDAETGPRETAASELSHQTPVPQLHFSGSGDASSRQRRTSSTPRVYRPYVDFASVVGKHNLDDSQRDALRDLIRRIEDGVETVTIGNNGGNYLATTTTTLTRELILDYLGCDRNPYDTLPFICQRFLRGRNFSSTEAMKAIRFAVSWNGEVDIEDLRNYDGVDENTMMRNVLECDPEQIVSRNPVAVCGEDMDGRPVCYKYMGSKCSVGKMRNFASTDALVRYHVWNTERLLGRLGDASTRKGRNIETFRVIIDAKGWHVGLFGSETAKFLFRIAKIDQDMYIERLHSMVIINAPSALSFCWRVVRTWLDERTAAKVNILSSPEQWFPHLKKNIPMNSIPECYGGSAKDDDSVEYTRRVRAAYGLSGK